MDDAAGPEVTVEDESEVPAGPWAEDGNQDCPAYHTAAFRMYVMKVMPCFKRYCHDWTLCPFAHPGEKARRRDPRTSDYAGKACPDMKKFGSCRRGNACPYAHTIFEYWLHPGRYRTQPCSDGRNCTRRVCFFAHSPQELRTPGSKLKSAGEDPQPGPALLPDANLDAASEAARAVKVAASGSEQSQLAPQPPPPALGAQPQEEEAPAVAADPAISNSHVMKMLSAMLRSSYDAQGAAAWPPPAPVSRPPPMPMIPSTGTVHPSEPSWDRTLATYEEMQDRTRQSSATSIPHSPQRSAVSASSMLSDPAPPEHMPPWPLRTPSASDLSPSKDAAPHSARSSRTSRGQPKQPMLRGQLPDMHAPASCVHEGSSGGPPGGPMGGPPATPSVPPATGLGYRQRSHPVRGQATHFEEAQEVAQALRGLSLPDDTMQFRPPLPPQAPPAVPHHMLQAADRPLPQMGLSRSELGHSSSLVPGLRAHTFPAAAAPLQAPGSSLDLGNPQARLHIQRLHQLQHQQQELALHAGDAYWQGTLLQGMQPGMQPPQILQPDYAAYQAPYRQGGAVGHPHALPDGQYAQQYKGHEVQHAGGQGSLGGAASPYASMSYLERLQALQAMKMSLQPEQQQHLQLLQQQQQYARQHHPTAGPRGPPRQWPQ